MAGGGGVVGDSAGKSRDSGGRESAERRRGYRALAGALGGGALGASLVLLAAGKVWTRGTVAFGQNDLPIHATGSQTTALPGALALTGLAALVAVFAVRRAGRYAVSALLTLSGFGVVLAVLTGRGDRGALNSAAATAVGLSRATAEHPATTGWPLVAAVGGLLLLLAGVLALRYGPRWPAMSSRYERGGARGPARAPVPVDPDRAEDLWKALDRGEDPTRAAD
ncbi:MULTISPECIES: TIGR02234 family membrane protein [unclassified Streptomyces]|uniref:TIGR02234 family membrane protein n=1 Tax=unclassified Streptomyces TaxID=2593676 RepID=UPI002E2E6660|nr:TIGR02234 family membrane protein [Streptomyces sp. NBC_00223]